MKQGLSFESFGGVAGVARSTLYEWVKAHPEFKAAKEIGTEASRLWWENTGISGIWNESSRDPEGGTHSKSLNSSVWIFNMKNRFGWRDKVEVSGDEKRPLVLSYNINDEPETDIDDSGDEQHGDAA